MGKDDQLHAPPPSSEGSAMLQAAFKKLKIDPEWSENPLSNCPDNDTLHRLWAGKGLSGKAMSPHNNTCHHRCDAGKGRSAQSVANHRVEPYALDCINTMQHLSFKSERCNKTNCGCKKSKSGLDSSTLNFVSGSSPIRRKIIWEEKLGLRNSEKDRNQIIRSAKLRLLREGKGFQAQQFFPFGRILKKGRHCGTPSCELPVFGSGTDNSPDFPSVRTELPPSSQSAESQSKDFNNSGLSLPVTGSSVVFSESSSRLSKRLGTDSADSPQQTLKRKSPCRLKQSPGASKAERKTCSLEARFSKEDFSVNELASYFENYVYIPKKMSSMAEMMYT